jgi:uncharacterized protein (UPF0332 family)
MRQLHKEEIKKEIERSKKSLEAARKLFADKLLEDAISRAYYSVLHAAKAVLLAENVKVDSHEAVKRLFGLYLVKQNKIDKKYSRILREEQDERFLADYDVAFSPEEAQVEKRIKDAESFLKEMIRFLQI